ncbi:MULTISPECIES: CAP domain-containing protein [unclassified Haematobacter]|uniref:CAP domain-containing protein n=1 Tax=unclassified Haematobacter TaxID=2640585 RepID=UPI0025BB44A0|nr:MULTISPECIES: CAP domain-containing protein [unclassified Haematobacter]
MIRHSLAPAFGLAGFLALSACIVPVPIVVPGSSRGPSAPASYVTAPAGQAGDVLRLINAERESQGLHPLSWSDRLAASAADHAAWIASTGTFSHTGEGGSSARDRMAARGYRGCDYAENISRGQPDAQAVVRGWMLSPGHRANNLRRSSYEAGAAMVRSSRGPVWVINFGAPCG